MYDKFCSTVHLTLCPNSSLVILNDFAHIGQSKTKSLYVMHITRRYAIKPFEHFFQMLFFNAYSIVLYGNNNIFLFVPCFDA